MTGEVIQSFLVSLGFDVDDSTLEKFNKALDTAVTRIGVMAAAVTAAAGGIFAGVASISSDFEKMGYEYRIIAPMINKVLILRQALLKAYGDAGINITQAVQQSVLFNFSLAKLKFQLEGIYKSVGMRFIPLLTKQMDVFRARIVQNMPGILKFLTNVVTITFKAFEVVTQFGKRFWEVLTKIWEVLVYLDGATNGWSTKILGLIAIWKALNLGFLLTPIGLVISGIVALIALYDDFKVWQEGGQSLINWGSDFTKIMVILIAALASLYPIIWITTTALAAWGAAVAAVTWVSEAYTTALGIMRAATWLFNLALDANPIGIFILAVAALAAAAYAVYKNWDDLKDWFKDFFGWIGEKFQQLAKIKEFFGGDTTQNINVDKTSTSPLGAGGAMAQHINQKTVINVQTNDDPNDIADAVMGQQSNVNFNMARNMKGAVR